MMKFFYLLPLLLFFVGCDEGKTPISGERAQLIGHDRLLKKDPDADHILIELMDPEPLNVWGQAGGNAQHKLPNAAFKGLHKIAWRTDIGSGKNAIQLITFPPIVGDGLVFSMDSRGDITALSEDNGQIVWAHASDYEVSSTGGGLAFSDGSVYASFSDGHVAKFDSKTGRGIWMVALPYGIRSAPTVLNNRLFVLTNNNQTYALNTETGDITWFHVGYDNGLSLAGSATPSATSYAVVAPYASGEIHVLYPDNGYSLWHDSVVSLTGLDSKSMISQIRALPVIDNNFLFVLSHGNQMATYDLRTGKKLWDKPIGSVNTPVVAEYFLFVLSNDNTVICLTKETGRILWTHALQTFSDPETKEHPITWSGPILANGNLLVVSTKGEILALSPQDGQIMETFTVDEGVISLPPVVANNKLYLLNDSGEVIAIS